MGNGGRKAPFFDHKTQYAIPQHFFTFLLEKEPLDMAIFGNNLLRLIYFLP